MGGRAMIGADLISGVKDTHAHLISSFVKHGFRLRKQAACFAVPRDEIAHRLSACLSAGRVFAFRLRQQPEADFF